MLTLPRLCRLSKAAALTGLLAVPCSAQIEEPSGFYVIGPRDLVSVEVLEDSSLETETRVTESGTLELPHIGPVEIAGLTTEQAARTLATAFEKYLQRATVSVTIIEYRSKPITVLGAVAEPGALPFSGRWTLLDAVAEAGGLTENAGGKIFILRRANNGLSDQLVVDTDDLLQTASPNVNIPLAANDLIRIPAATKVTILCMGAVERKGAVEFRSTDRVTLLAAIARAGGRSDRASSTVVVRRSATREELKFNYRKLLAGTTPDIELDDGDIVIVKESFF